MKLLKSLKHTMPFYLKKRKLKYSVREHYRRYHNIKDLDILDKIIKAKHPKYYSSYHEVLNNNWLYANNMFVLSKDNFEKFMPWWFSILLDFEKAVSLNEYEGYQQRIFGFLERTVTYSLVLS